MITDKGMQMARRLDAYCYKKHWGSYTLKVTHWEDEDFRLFAYVSKAVPDDQPWESVYIEYIYQDSQMDDGVVLKRITAQEDDAPHNESKQQLFPGKEPEELELPTLQSVVFRSGDEQAFQKPDHDPHGETCASAAHSVYTCPVCRKSGLVGTIALDFMEEDNYLIVCDDCP